MAETNMESHGTFQKLGAIEPSCSIPSVSYTHLDVYKRQFRTGAFCCSKNFLKKFISNFLLFLFVLFIFCLLYTSNETQTMAINFTKMAKEKMGDKVKDFCILDVYDDANNRAFSVEFTEMCIRDRYSSIRKHVRDHRILLTFLTVLLR